jgi:hypothetical protein
MSPDAVIIRDVKDAPAAVVTPEAQFAPTSRSFAFLVVSDPLLLELLFPDEPTATSSGCNGSMPEYSATRTSGVVAPAVNVTVTVFAPAAAVAWFSA